MTGFAHGCLILLDGVRRITLAEMRGARKGKARLDGSGKSTAVQLPLRKGRRLAAPPSQIPACGITAAGS